MSGRELSDPRRNDPKAHGACLASPYSRCELCVAYDDARAAIKRAALAWNPSPTDRKFLRSIRVSPE